MIYLESFHEGKKSELYSMLEKENWKKLTQSSSKNSDPVLVSSKEEQFSEVPTLHSIIFSKQQNIMNVSGVNIIISISTKENSKLKVRHTKENLKKIFFNKNREKVTQPLPHLHP